MQRKLWGKFWANTYYDMWVYYFIGLFSLVNEAYDVESGDSGLAFKNCPRLLSPFDGISETDYNEGRLLKAVDKSKPNKPIVGMIYYELDGDSTYFGPFAVFPSYAGKGVGKALFQQVKVIGKTLGATSYAMNVSNHRTDLFPIYEKWGFKKTGQSDFPDPERLTRPTFFYTMKCDYWLSGSERFLSQ